MEELEKPTKRKDQIRHDEEVAQRLQAQMQVELEEEDRLVRQREEEANISSWDNVQAMIDVDYQMAQQMQAEEQEKLSIEEKSKFIVDWKILKEGKITYFQIIRADESSKRYSAFIQMLKRFDREDLETLWKLVKAKHGSTRPEEGYKRVLWGDLKTMFEPHVEDTDLNSSDEQPEFIIVDDHYVLNEHDDSESVKDIRIAEDQVSTIIEPVSNVESSPTIISPSTEVFINPPVPQDRWSKEKHIELVNIFGEPQAGVTTRSRIRYSKAASTHECLYVNFLSEIEPKKLIEALEEEGWIIAMQEELNQFERNKVWNLVLIPHGKTIIETKWIWKNTMDEHGVIVKNKARLERISKKRTKNEAKTTKPDTEWKSVEKDKVKSKPKFEKVNPDKPEAKKSRKTSLGTKLVKSLTCFKEEKKDNSEKGLILATIGKS
ncbi:hypothetical protein Tco_0144503 [Tanacetum coccineum]